MKTPFLKIAAAMAACVYALPIAAADFTPSAETRVEGFHVSLAVMRSGDVTVQGRTDFPDGTRLMVTIANQWLADGMQRASKGLPICRETCAPAMGENGQPGGWATVRDGRFTAGPFQWPGRRQIEPGSYVVDVHLGSLPGEPAWTDSTQTVPTGTLRMQRAIFTTVVRVD